MSVINKMLRDLEARRATPAAASGTVHATAGQARRSRLLPLLMLGGAALGAILYGDWPALLNVSASQAPVPLTVAESVDPVPVIAAAPPAATEAASASIPTTDAPPAAVTPKPAVVATRQSRHAVVAPTAAARPVALVARAPLSQGSPPALLGEPDDSPARPTPSAAPARPTAIAAALPSIEKRMATQSPTQRAQALYRQGLELIGSGHGRQALERLLEALKLDAGLNPARIHAASLLLEQGRGAEAEALARDGLAMSTDDPQLPTLLARLMADRGDSAGALAMLGRSERLAADGFGLRAGLRAQQGDFRRALPDYEQAVRLQPGNSLWWLGLGVALEAEGRLPQARQVYARAQAIGLGRHDLNTFVDQKLQSLE